LGADERRSVDSSPAIKILQAAARDINQNILALAPPAPKAANVPPPKPLAIPGAANLPT
jgi:hypothetical protein